MNQTVTVAEPSVRALRPEEIKLIHTLNQIKDYLKVIQPLFDDNDVTEIMINSPDNIWCKNKGQIIKTDYKIDPIQLKSAMKATASANEKDVSATFDARLPGVRIAATLAPVSINGHSMCIRKHMMHAIELEDYEERGAFDLVDQTKESANSEKAPYAELKLGGKGVTKFITWLVDTKKTILIAGATDSGKTTLMRAILSKIPESQRLLTIEDTSELNLTRKNLVSFECNPELKVDIRRLVRMSLRYAPQRVVVGEVRGAEVYDMIDVLNTGHPGGCTSMHADSAELALYRLESMMRMAPESANLPLIGLRNQIANAFKFVIFASGKFGVRAPEEIIEVKGVDDAGNYIIKSIFNKQKEYLDA